MAPGEDKDLIMGRADVRLAQLAPTRAGDA